MSRLPKILMTVLGLTTIVLGGVVVWGYGQYRSPGPSTATTTLIIERGSGIDGIALELFHAGVLADITVFRIAARLMTADDPLKAGEFAFAPGISPERALELLQSGKTVTHRLTIAEGLTAAEVMGQLTLTEGLTGAVRPLPPEGSLLPETYHFSFGDGRREIVRRMTEAMDEALKTTWRNRAGGLPLESPREALILASIVEKETALAAERPRIAAVFLNRLKKGMRLQSDPTVVYGLAGAAGALGRTLSRDDLKRPTPYNTYLIDGLPPTPISNPGGASLEAVMRPAETGDLYFVADGSGGHVFSATLKEHNRNVAKWRRFQKRR